MSIVKFGDSIKKQSELRIVCNNSIGAITTNSKHQKYPKGEPRFFLGGRAVNLCFFTLATTYITKVRIKLSITCSWNKIVDQHSWIKIFDPILDHSSHRGICHSVGQSLSQKCVCQIIIHIQNSQSISKSS